MTTNLTDPKNKEVYQVEQIKRLTSLWIYQMGKNKLTRLQVDKKLAGVSPDQQETFRYWLNHYRELSTSAKAAPTNTRKPPPLWVQNRQKLKAKNRPYAK